MTNSIVESQDALVQFFNDHAIDSHDEKTERLALYRSLILSTVDDVLTSIYPYTRLFFQDVWLELLTSFVAEYPPVNYHVFSLAEPLHTYFKTTSNKPDSIQRIMTKNPFLSDLALYEWREVDIANRKNPVIPVYKPIQDSKMTDDLLMTKLVWNPVLAMDTLQYAIPEVIELLKTKKKIDISRCQKETHIVQYRELDSDIIRFFVLNPFTSQVIKTTSSKSVSLQEAMDALNVSHSLGLEPSMLLQQALPWLKDCQKSGLLLGVCQ